MRDQSDAPGTRETPPFEDRRRVHRRQPHTKARLAQIDALTQRAHEAATCTPEGNAAWVEWIMPLIGNKVEGCTKEGTLAGADCECMTFIRGLLTKAIERGLFTPTPSHDGLQVDPRTISAITNEPSTPLAPCETTPLGQSGSTARAGEDDSDVIAAQKLEHVAAIIERITCVDCDLAEITAEEVLKYLRSRA